MSVVESIDDGSYKLMFAPLLLSLQNTQLMLFPSTCVFGDSSNEWVFFLFDLPSSAQQMVISYYTRTSEAASDLPIGCKSSYIRSLCLIIIVRTSVKSFLQNEGG